MRHSGLHREPQALLRPGVRPAPRRAMLAFGAMLIGFGFILASATSLLLA